MDKLAEIKAFNDTFIEMVKAGQTKEAAVSAQQFTRNKLREESFFEKILTPIDISNDELNPAEDPELLVKWCDREPDQAPAVAVPLGVVPDGMQFKGSRYPVYFSRIMSPMFSKDIDKLRGYTYDIRAILLENATKDIASEIDSKGLNKVDEMLGLINQANTFNGLGLPQYVSFSGGITRQNILNSFAVIQKLRVPFGPMQPDGSGSKGCILMNNVTASQVLGFERSEVGGDLSQRMFTEGKLPEQLFGVKVITTIKRDLVPDNRFYLFSSEDFLGKYFRLQPLTVYAKSEAFFLKFFEYLNIGMSIGNAKGACKIDFV